MGNFVGGITPEQVRRGNEAVRKTALSMTWKERHAKGVPARCSTESGRTNWRMLSNRVSDNLWHITPFVRDWEYPELSAHIPMIWAGSYDPNNKISDFEPVATFCNFRYKPDWFGVKLNKQS